MLFHKKLFLYPQRNCGDKTYQALRSKNMISLKQTFKFQEWFFIKSHSSEIVIIHTGFLKYISNCIYGETGVMFNSRKSFFLTGCYYFSINYDCCRTIVIKCRNSQYPCPHSNQNIE